MTDEEIEQMKILRIAVDVVGIKCINADLLIMIRLLKLDLGNVTLKELYALDKKAIQDWQEYCRKKELSS